MHLILVILCLHEELYALLHLLLFLNLPKNWVFHSLTLYSIVLSTASQNPLYIFQQEKKNAFGPISEGYRNSN